MNITSFAQLPTPLPYPYQEKADANAAGGGGKNAGADPRKIAAHRSRRQLVSRLPDSGAGTLQQPELKAFIDSHYEVVTVDVGRFDKNLQIPAHYGLTQRLEGVPSLLIVDPRTDRLLDAGHVPALADARHMTPQALADWLAQWTP